jgi:Protein of unknown function (DUF3467)
MVDAPKAPTPPLRLMRAKDFRVAFSNTFRFRLSNTDVGLAFGYQTEIPGPQSGSSQALIQDEVEIVMTPFTLKLLQKAISDNIEILEKQIGTIQLPQELVDALDAAKARAKAQAEK